MTKRPVPQPQAPPEEVVIESPSIRWLRRTLLTLVVVLTFEGLARKVNFHGTSVVIFLLKDFIIAIIGVQILRLRLPKGISWLSKAYIAEIVLFAPVIIQTGLHDTVLAVFGAKEYLLYPIVAFAVFTVFENASKKQVISFFRALALLLIPTTAIALLQLRLPASNWLNLSTGGDSLDAFSAGGHLRVSSTFSFVAQYCSFINAEVFILMIALNNLRGMGLFKRLVYLSLVPMLIVSSYVTGSRSAVLVNVAIILVATGLSVMEFRMRSAMRMGAIIVGVLVTLVVVQFVVPDAFQAYSVREEGHMLGATTEMQDRVYSMLFDWVADVSSTPFFGKGLGLMSNGSEMISSYAAGVRAFTWTETDFSSTLFEGGIYLIFVWYGFRYYVIFQVVRHHLKAPNNEFSVPSAFCVGSVVVIGLSGTLGIQPPIAIWWWLSVGSAMLFWWKAVEPKQESDPGTGAPAPAGPRKIRGRSAYAERLHVGKTP